MSVFCVAFESGRRAAAACIACLFVIAGLLPLQQALAQSAPADAAQEFANPMSKFTIAPIENDLFFLDGDITGKTRPANVTLLNPLIPVPLADSGWTVINRPILPIISTVDIPTPGGSSTVPPSTAGTLPTGGFAFDDVAGLGDFTYFALLTPPNDGNGFLWGAGITTKWPTATDDRLGSEKYQAGPAAIALYSSPEFTAGALVQHWWDYAGDSDRADVSLTNIQYFYNIKLNEQWSIAAGPLISINHEGTSGNKYSVPIGIGLAHGFKVGDVPARLLVEYDYYVKQLDAYGPRHNIRAALAFILPPLFGN